MNMTTTFALAAFAVLGASGLVALNTFNANVWHQPTAAVASFYDLHAETLEGDAFSFANLKDKRVLIVNTASRCGYTPQYKSLEALHNRYKDQGLVILGFPCNQFGMQEPGSTGDIREFCTRKYGVSFQMMSKVKVKGDDQHPVYAWLTQKALNGSGDHKVRWNFCKFLVNEKGELAAALGSGADPLGQEIIAFAEGK
ncbi:MAG: glutathione peroxidase [Bacteroidota bacterium]|nr:glutathione peroxidase [Bacteroidota bacterium]